MKDTANTIQAILNILRTLSPGALRRVLAYAERERHRWNELL